MVFGYKNPEYMSPKNTSELKNWEACVETIENTTNGLLCAQTLLNMGDLKKLLFWSS